MYPSSCASLADARTTLTATLALLAAAVPGCDDSANPGPVPGDTAAVALQPVATGLDFPVYLTAPSGDARLFVVEKTGRIRIIRDGAVADAPFLDLRGQISTDGERGLLGLAFAPDYAASGRFYVDFTDPDGNTHVVGYRVSAADPNRADPATAETLLTVDQPYANHNGGEVAFGPDGMLYVGLGDGGGGGDPQRTGQSPADLLGSLLRIDPRAPSGGLPYTVPPDNPFRALPGARPELWAIGLRNPWRFSWDRETGDLYVADVGQGDWEELDVSPASDGRGAGANYGWSITEGRHCYGAAACDTTGLTLPVLEYGHDQGCSITGGYVYRGSVIPELRGQYLYGDFCGQWVRSVRIAEGRAGTPREWPSLRAPGQLTSFGEDAAGELYLLDAGGTVSKIVPR